MSLKARLVEDMKAAMKSGEKDKLLVIRLINAAIKQREVDERIELDDSQVLAAMEKMLKQRRDSVEQYEKAARERRRLFVFLGSRRIFPCHSKPVSSKT